MPAEQRAMINTLGVPAERITTAVDVTDYLDRKRQAMQVHASQISRRVVLPLHAPRRLRRGVGDRVVHPRRRRGCALHRGLAARHPVTDPTRRTATPQPRVEREGDLPGLPRLPARQRRPQASRPVRDRCPAGPWRRAPRSSGSSTTSPWSRSTGPTALRRRGDDVGRRRVRARPRRHRRVGAPPLRRSRSAHRRDRDGLPRSGATPGPGRHGLTLRWMLAHVLEETARHAGHLDILRELVDGRTGR